MDLVYIEEVIPLFAKAIIFTVRLSLFGIVISIIMGIVCSIAQYYKIPIIKSMSIIYIEL